MLSLRQLVLRRTGTNDQFRAAFFVVSPLSLRPVRFQLDLIQPLTVLAQLCFDRVSALRALTVLGFELLYVVSLRAHLLRNAIYLSIDHCAFAVQLRELAGEHNPQLGSHFVAQLGIALGFRRLPLQRVHLPRDFLEDVAHARQVLLSVLETRFRQPLLRLEFRNSGSLFDNRPPVGRTAAQNLPNPSLLDERIRLRPEARAHEQFLNIAQPAQLSIQQIFAIARAKQPPRNDDLPSPKLLLKFPPPNLQHHRRPATAT